MACGVIGNHCDVLIFVALERPCGSCRHR